MNCPIGTQKTTARRPEGAERTGGAAMGDRAEVLRMPLRCVWSGSADRCSCSSRIDREVVADAWQRELEVSGDHEARFFHFIWDGGVWMADGVENGEVRGLYG